MSNTLYQKAKMIVNTVISERDHHKWPQMIRLACNGDQTLEHYVFDWVTAEPIDFEPPQMVKDYHFPRMGAI